MSTSRARQEPAPIEVRVTAEDAGGHDEEALFSEETLPRIERWSVELVRANAAAGGPACTNKIADDCIVEASATLLAPYGRALAVIHLAIYATHTSPMPTVRGCMVIGFTANGLQRVNFYRPSNHGISIDAPECSSEIERVFRSSRISNGDWHSVA